MTSQRCISRVTRAGDGGGSERSTIDARKSAQWFRLIGFRLIGPRETRPARDRPDRAACLTVEPNVSAEAHLGLVGGGALDPFSYQKYDDPSMLDHSFTDAATEPCRVGELGLRKEQAPRGGSGGRPRRSAHRSGVHGGTHPVTNGSGANHSGKTGLEGAAPSLWLLTGRPTRASDQLFIICNAVVPNVVTSNVIATAPRTHEACSRWTVRASSSRRRAWLRKA